MVDTEKRLDAGELFDVAAPSARFAAAGLWGLNGLLAAMLLGAGAGGLC